MNTDSESGNDAPYNEPSRMPLPPFRPRSSPSPYAHLSSSSVEEAIEDPPIWRRIRVNGQNIRVSERGYLVIKHGITYGYALPGTPYRTVPIGDREYLVHDLVWRAFHGDPPNGYEVRHTRAAAYEAALSPYYDNSLRNLQLCQTNITYHPRLAPTVFSIENTT